MTSEWARFLDDTPFEEIPVDAKTFVEGEEYLGLPPLSDYQYDLVRVMSQIYRPEDLDRFMDNGYAYAKKWTKKEVVMALGKGTTIGETRTWSPEYGYKKISDKLEDYGLIQSNGCVNAATAFYSEGEEDVFRITTKFGYSFVGNLNHKFYGWKNTRHSKTYTTKGEPSKIAICESAVGDVAAILGDWEEPETPYSITEQEARLIGYMLGDGTMVRDTERGYKNPMFTNDTKEVQEDFEKIVLSLGGSLSHGESGFGCWQVRVNGITDWFVKHGLVQEYHGHKRWNDEWMNMSSACLGQLLNGLWATDGWLHVQHQPSARGRKSTSSVHVAIEMVSESVMRGVHMALLRLGVFASLKKNRPVRSGGKHSATWRISMTNSHFVEKFIEKVGAPVGKTEQTDEVSKNLKSGYKNLKQNGNVYRDRIVNIERAGREEVFACTVETGHNYMGNGFIHGQSGKDYCSTVATAYVVYKLLCLKDPARYYGKPPRDAIDIINIAINAQQARNVFFKGLLIKIKASPWFRGKYVAKMDSIEFDKNITVYSGHSERESHEGLNLFMAVLDEISGFGEGNALTKETGKTGENIYKAFRGTVDSRFPDYGKVVLLSFPRHAGCFISKKYSNVIAAKEVVKRSHTWVLNEDLPRDAPGNTLTIEWEEDHITKYEVDGVYALKRPTWEMNPTREIEDFKMAFYTDPVDARTRFLAEPADVASDAFFRSREKIVNAMSIRNPVNPLRVIDEGWKPDPDKVYYVHADLAQVQDKCAVAVAHVDKWVKIEMSERYSQVVPFVVVDMIAYWDPKKEGAVDLSEVKRWIQGLRHRGLHVGLATFDRWGCLPEDSLVYTPTGPKQIKDIDVGEEVVTRHGVNVIETKSDMGQQEVFRVKTRLGYEIEATASHMMLTDSGWKTVSELTNNDRLLLSQSHSYGGNYLSDEQAYAFGALIADGWINHKKDQMVNLCTEDVEFFDRVYKSLVVGWGYKNSPSIQQSPEHDVKTYSFWDKAMVGRMRNAGLKRSTAKDKSVPYSVFESSFSARASFLSGFIDGDGGIQRYVDKSGVERFRLTMDTSSELLAKQLVWLAHSLKLEPTILRQERISSKSGKSVGNYCMHRLTFEGKKAERALDVLSMSIERKTRVENKELRGAKERWVFENGELWLNVKSVESIGQKHTYDIGVPSSGEFICQGFVTHNSYDIQKELNDSGLRAETLSVAKKHYEDVAMLLYEDRLIIPNIELLLEEMLELKVVNQNKVDHPSKSSKDLSDAMTGAVFNAISRTPRDVDQEIEIHTPSKTYADRQPQEEKKPELTEEAKDWLVGLGML